MDMSILIRILIIFLNILILGLVAVLCHPCQATKCLEISASLKSQPIPFESASGYFYRHAMVVDKELPLIRQRIDELTENNEFDQALAQLDTILDRYPIYEDASSIREKIDQARKEFITKKTKEAIRCFNNGKMDAAFQAATLADAENPRISLILGLRMLARENRKTEDYQAAEKALLFAAQNGVARAMLELGKLYDPMGDAWRNSSAKNAEEWYKEAFRHKVYEAAYYLAEMLDRMGNVSDAFAWMTQASDKGVIAAQKGLAKMHCTGRGVEKDVGKAIQLYEALANQGDTEAQLALGKIYCDKGLAQFHYGKAIDCYLKAAMANNIEAQVALAQMYESGLGIDKNAKEAEMWYRKAAGNGSEQARAWVTERDEQLRADAERKARLAANIEKALEAWAEALDSGSDSKHRLAVKLANEADPDNSGIQAMLAYEYYNGKGAKKDVKRAVELAQKAAKAGEPIGYYILAQYYEGFPPSSSTGRGSSKEYILTCLYYEKAAKGGIVPAQCKVAELCIWGRGFDDGKTRLRDIKKKLYKSRSYGMGSDNPYVTNIHNYEKALFWLNKAYQAGSIDAAEALADAYIIGYGEPDQYGCGKQGINCVGSIPKDRVKALEIINWINERDPDRAARLRSYMQ